MDQYGFSQADPNVWHFRLSLVKNYNCLKMLFKYQQLSIKKCVKIWLWLFQQIMDLDSRAYKISMISYQLQSHILFHIILYYKAIIEKTKKTNNTIFQKLRLAYTLLKILKFYSGFHTIYSYFNISFCIEKHFHKCRILEIYLKTIK